MQRVKLIGPDGEVIGPVLAMHCLPPAGSSFDVGNGKTVCVKTGIPRYAVEKIVNSLQWIASIDVSVGEAAALRYEGALARR